MTTTKRGSNMTAKTVCGLCGKGFSKKDREERMFVHSKYTDSFYHLTNFNGKCQIRRAA